MDKTSFLKYLALGEQKPAPATETAEDYHMLDLTPSAARGWFPPMKALPKPQYPIKPGRVGDLEEHDRRFHPEGYKEGDKCKYREELAKKDEADRIAAEANNVSTRLNDFAKKAGFTGSPVDVTASFTEHFGNGETVYKLKEDWEGYKALAVHDPEDDSITLYLHSPANEDFYDIPLEGVASAVKEWESWRDDVRKGDLENAEAEREYLDMVRRS